MANFPATLKTVLIPCFCLFHMSAIFWWTLPHSFSRIDLENSQQNRIENYLLNWLNFEETGWPYTILSHHIDITGNQQYWDFFAPQSPKFHQYLSVCESIVAYPDQGKISCSERPLFSNLEDLENQLPRQRSLMSRWYRLTENLINLNNPLLLEKFTHFYRTHQNHSATQVSLVLHQFELYPNVLELPKAGYRMDKLLMQVNN